MAGNWFYEDGGKKLGPVSSEQLKQLAESGKLARTAMVWKVEGLNAVPAERVKSHFAEPVPLVYSLYNDFAASDAAASRADPRTRTDG